MIIEQLFCAYNQLPESNKKYYVLHKLHNNSKNTWGSNLSWYSIIMTTENIYICTVRKSGHNNHKSNV